MKISDILLESIESIHTLLALHNFNITRLQKQITDDTTIYNSNPTYYNLTILKQVIMQVQSYLDEIIRHSIWDKFNDTDQDAISVIKEFVSLKNRSLQLLHRLPKT